MDWSVFWSTFIASFVGTGLAGVIAFVVYIIQRIDRRKEIKEDKAYEIVKIINNNINELIRDIAEYHIISKQINMNSKLYTIQDLYNLTGKISRARTSLTINEKVASTIFNIDDKDNYIIRTMDEVNKHYKLLPLTKNVDFTVAFYIEQLVVVEESLNNKTFNTKVHSKISEVLSMYYSSLCGYYLAKYEKLIETK